MGILVTRTGIRLVTRTGIDVLFALRKPLRAAAAAPLAKNSPQDCFLDARA